MLILIEQQARTLRDRFNRPPYSVSCTDNSTHFPADFTVLVRFCDNYRSSYQLVNTGTRLAGISLASTPLRGGGYALDHFRDSADSVAPRTRRLLHAGRAHPSTLGGCARGTDH